MVRAERYKDAYVQVKTTHVGKISGEGAGNSSGTDSGSGESDKEE